MLYVFDFIVESHFSDVIMASQITGVPIVLLNRLLRRKSKKTSKIRVTGLCQGNSPVTDEFPTQRANNAENASIWWRHHIYIAEDWVTIKHITLFVNSALVAYEE